MAWNDDNRYYTTQKADLERAIESRKARIIKADLSLTDPKAWDQTLWQLAGTRSYSGEMVNEYSALTFSAVYCAVSLIAGTIGSLPLHLHKDQGKLKVLSQDSQVYYLMSVKPNPYMTAMAFREALMAHVLTWGNAYAEKVKNVMGEIVQLWPITPNRVRVMMEGGALVYKVRVGNEEITMPRESILHIPGLGFDGFMGYSVIAMARKTIGLGMALETFGSLYFGNGTHPGIIVSHPGKLSPVAHENLRTTMATTYSGLGQAHRLMLLEEGMKLEKLGIPPNDSQFLESRQHQIPEIARWFNLPPHKLKDLTRSSFNNIESEQISFLTDSILPWLVRIEANYNMQLLNEKEQRADKLYFKHNVDGLLRGNPDTRAQFYARMWGIGAMSINEIRAKEEMDPDPDPLADQKFIPVNMAPLGKAGQAPPAPNPALPVPVGPPANGGGNGQGQ